jgi:hypothetical protein
MEEAITITYNYYLILTSRLLILVLTTVLLSDTVSII